MYCVLNFGWKPADFARLGRKEKAFVVACIESKAARLAEMERGLRR